MTPRILGLVGKASALGAGGLDDSLKSEGRQSPPSGHAVPAASKFRDL